MIVEKSKKDTLFQGKIRTKSGSLMSMFQRIWLIKEEKHSHNQENARRKRQIERGIIRITSALLFFIYLMPAFASETFRSPTTEELVNDIKILDLEKEKIPSIQVRLEVEDPGVFWDFSTVLLPSGSTTTDALATSHRIILGRVCLDPEGVFSIDGIAYYWMVSVNGDTQNVNAHTILKSGDRVKWQYVSAHRNPDHNR